MMNILGLNAHTGQPFKWLTPERAITYLAKGRVIWDLGDEDAVVLRGGFNKHGDRSIMGVKPIIAVAGDEVTAAMFDDVYPLGTGNAELFKRDRYTCAYCGGRFHKKDLTRDHIVPRGQGGHDVWTNCISACRICNHSKGCKTPEQWGRELLFVPYAPSRWERYILEARGVISPIQMDYLAANLPAHSRALQ